MRLVAALVGVLLAVSACQSNGPAAAGIVITIDQPAINRVEGFELRTEDGRVLDFAVGELRLDSGAFRAEHLREHMALAQPIAVGYHDEGGQLVADRLADAPWAR